MFTTNIKRTYLGSNPSLAVQRPATDRLSNGTANTRKLSYILFKIQYLLQRKHNCNTTTSRFMLYTDLRCRRVFKGVPDFI